MTRRKIHLIRDHLRATEAVGVATRALHLAVLRCDRKTAHRAVDRLIDMNLAAGAPAPVTLPAPMGGHVMREIQHTNPDGAVEKINDH